jgi:tRNA(Ile)-lysidine synthase
VTPDLGAAVAALAGRTLRDDEPLAIAVSGGADSLALLRLAHRVFGDRVRALTVDHGLRPAAAAEAALVADYAAALDVPHVTLRWDGPYPAANLQAAAREARYTLMGDWCSTQGVGWLATAHHADDQAEIRARRPLCAGVEVLRPLLGATKADLAAIVAAAGWIAVDDPSNRAARFDRTHARTLLAATPWLDRGRLAASAAHLAEVEAALCWTAEMAWRGHAVVTSDAVTLDAAGLPRELARRLLLRAVTALVPGATLRGDGIDRVLQHLAIGSGGTIAGVSVRACDSGNGPKWTFKIAAPRR